MCNKSNPLEGDKEPQCIIMKDWLSPACTALMLYLVTIFYSVGWSACVVFSFHLATGTKCGNVTLAEISYLMFGKSICLSINQSSFPLWVANLWYVHTEVRMSWPCATCSVRFRSSSLAVSVTLQSVAFLNIIHKISSESPFAYSLRNCSCTGENEW